MDFRILAQEELRSMDILRTAEENTGDELKEIESYIRSVSSYDGVQALDLKVLRDDLKMRLEASKNRRARINRALSALSEDERVLLEYYASGRDPMDAMERLRIEKSAYYRLRGEAMERFTRAMFGVILT